jgi:UDP-N-acetylglucosamine--N-acetylmuramyl-(pentapeptide) pyrophosphoryl-undecaprenol N-acetylglucosamine transferase
LYYFGEAGGIEEELARTAGIPFQAVATGQIRGRSPVQRVRSLARMIQGVRQCGDLMRRQRPDAVFITGGYVTVPLAWAAWRAHVPVLIYLPDLEPGLAIRWMSRLATRVAVSFPEVAHFFGSKAVVTGYPVRAELVSRERNAARQALGLQSGPHDPPVLLVFGGSRGARSINQALVAALPQLLEHAQVVHVSGQLDWPWVAEAAGKLPAEVRGRYHAYPYLHGEMLDALAAADLAVARAGASTLGEFPVVGLPSVLVPYPYAGQHQHINADYLASRGAAVIVEDQDLGARLAPAVSGLLQAPERREQMARAARALARPDAAANIARLLYQMAGA